MGIAQQALLMDAPEVVTEPGVTGWNVLKIGGGGFVTSYSSSNDGATRVVRTDTYGDYRWSEANDRWESMLTYDSMGPSVAVSGGNSYTYEAVVAPGDASRVYRWWKGKVWKSTDGGLSWTVTAYAEVFDAMASNGQGFGSRTGGKYMAVAPADADLLLAGSFLNGLRRTSNGGASWTDIASVPVASWNGYKVNGAHTAGATTIAVNTGTIGISNNSIVYFTETGNTAFSATTGIVSGSGNITISPPLTANIASAQLVRSVGGIRLAFDPSTAGVCYAHSWGNGVYKSTDYGVTFTAIAGGPLAIFRLACAIDGKVYVVAENGDVWKYASSTWTQCTTGNQWYCIACDPNNAARVVACSGGTLYTSLDYGAFWTMTTYEYWEPNCMMTSTNPWPGQRRDATGDIPWLEWTNECVISVADIWFDTVLGGSTSRLWAATGVGVMYYDMGGTTTAPSAQITWQIQTRGIENLVTNHIVKPPGGYPLVCCWDRPIFRITDPETFPATHGPNPNYAINMCWSVDYAAGSPDTLAANIAWFGRVPYSGISTDGGATWTPFATFPANHEAGCGGSIAMSTPDNIVWAMQGNNYPSYTLDGGDTWTGIMTFPYAPSESGFGFAYYLSSQLVAADRVNEGTFYIYNYGPGDAALRGIHRSTDGGATWLHISSTPHVPGASPVNCKLRTVPGHAGHMFFTLGMQGDNTVPYGGFWYSTTGASASAGTQVWTAVATVGGVHSFGIGAAPPGGDYPSVYICGWVSDVYGIWRGTGTAAQWAANSGVVWTDLTADTGGMPLGLFDVIKTVEGDIDEYGTCYIGFGGTGAVYYRIPA